MNIWCFTFFVIFLSNELGLSIFYGLLSLIYINIVLSVYLYSSSFSLLKFVFVDLSGICIFG